LNLQASVVASDLVEEVDKRKEASRPWWGSRAMFSIAAFVIILVGVGGNEGMPARFRSPCARETHKSVNFGMIS
jgi:hypothetical protein